MVAYSFKRRFVEPIELWAAEHEGVAGFEIVYWVSA